MELIDESDMSIFKFSKPYESRRFIPKPDFAEFLERRLVNSAGFKYALSIDINRFYASIYTHSIPWAAHGKSFAKLHRKMEHYGNQLDSLCREAQDGQTLGIPIGPDASRIISEMILSKIDKEIAQMLVQVEYAGVRNVDDYHLYFRSQADLEFGKGKVEKAIRTYELELNIAKERVNDLPEIIEMEWRTAIRSFQIRNRSSLQRIDLIAYFDLSTSLARKFSDDNVVSYCIGKLKGFKVEKAHWNLLQAFLMHCIIMESKSIELVVKHLISYKSLGYKIHKSIVKNALDSFLDYHIEHDHHFEILWTLWYYATEKTTVKERSVKQLTESSNDFIIILARHLNDEGLMEAKVKTANIGKKAVMKATLQSENWLLAYQLQDEDPFGFDDPFYDMLYEKEVSFFQIDNINEEGDTVETSTSSLAFEEQRDKSRRRGDDEKEEDHVENEDDNYDLIVDD
ncbi:MAG: RNA-directed DNA polymerase [Chitinophagaceae bacterium]